MLTQSNVAFKNATFPRWVMDGIKNVMVISGLWLDGLRYNVPYVFGAEKIGRSGR